MSAGERSDDVGASLALPGVTAQHLVGLLETLRALPSTPRPVADDAASLIQRVEAELPWHRDRQRCDRITLDQPTMIAIAELLGLFAAMPSTPPMVAEQAERQASLLWRELDA